MKYVSTYYVYETTAFHVTTNEDRNEGRGHTIDIGYFQHRIDAENAARGQGVMGTNADIKPCTVQVLKDPEKGEDMFVIKKMAPFYKTYLNKEALRKQILAKLTAEEIEILGVK